MNRTRRESTVALLGALGLIVASTFACHKDAALSGRKISIGIQVSPAMALVMVAKDQGLFGKYGLDVELKPFTAGKFALQALLGGSLDFAVCGDVPIALAAMQGNDVRVVSQVVGQTTNEVRVVVRRDGAAQSPDQFFGSKKRKLATSFGGGPEFFTYTFLRHFGIDPGKVEIISQRPEDMPVSLASRSVDAVSVFDPFAFLAEQRLGAEAVVYRDDKLYSELYLLAARPRLLETEPLLADGILRALGEAAGSIAARPNEAKQVVERYTKLDGAVIDSIWRTFDFHIALRRQLLDYWQTEAEWARDTGKAVKGGTLHFESLLAPDALMRVDASAVQL